MEALFLLIPFSAMLVLALIALFAWALNAGQFDNVEQEAWRILADKESVDANQSANERAPGK